MQNKQVTIYRDLVKDLNQIIYSFIETSEINKSISAEDLSEKISRLNIAYRFRVDSSIKSVNYKLFPEDDNFFINTSFFKVDSSAKEPRLNYYLTCIKILDEHLKIIKTGRPTFSHDPCTN